VVSVFWRGAWLNSADLEARKLRLAARLLELGVSVGERVGVLSQNHPVHLDSLSAALEFGFIHAPFNYRLPPLELTPLVDYIAPKVFIYAAEFAEHAHAAKIALPELNLLPLETLEALPFSTPPSSYKPQDSDVLMLLFTGGTTGIAKAAQISRAMYFENIRVTVEAWELTPEDCTVQSTPMFHAGINALVTPLLAIGARVAILEKFSPTEYLEMVRQTRSSILFAVPTIFLMLLETAEFAEFDFSFVKYALAGGSPCPAPVRQAFAKKGVQFRLGYGMTEVGVNCFTQNLHSFTKFDSVGCPMPDLNAVLRDENGNPTEIGELTFSGKQVMSGYWKKPLETADVLRPIDGQMWLFTGDLAAQDEDGDYRIIGRSKDMIISGGENIYPLEIETALYAHPNVLECAVVGISNQKWGEVVRAVVVARSPVPAETLRQFLRGRLANYKIPKEFVFMSELPKSAAGKILKNKLRQVAPPLVCIHGNYASGRWWSGLELVAAIAPTLPGFAGTPALPDTTIATLSDWLLTQLPPEKPVLLGHSLGGVLALELAAREPTRYAGLILVCSPSLAGFPHNPAGDPIRAMLPHNRPLLAQLFTAQSPQLPQHSGELWEGILDDAQALPPEIGNGISAELGIWNRLESASSLAALPVLILAGEKDILVTPEMTKTLHTQLPHATLELLPDVGHWLPLERQDWFEARVAAFLEAL
jgi:fatty-acyl-CoA synthase